MINSQDHMLSLSGDSGVPDILHGKFPSPGLNGLSENASQTQCCKEPRCFHFYQKYLPGGWFLAPTSSEITPGMDTARRGGGETLDGTSEAI